MIACLTDDKDIKLTTISAIRTFKKIEVGSGAYTSQYNHHVYHNYSFVVMLPLTDFSSKISKIKRIKQYFLV